jgi:hypothetical protein
VSSVRRVERIDLVRRVLGVVAAVLLVGCTGAKPKPLPGGPPPEYEPARSYDGGVGEPGTAAPAATPPAAPAPAPATGAPSPTVAPP